MKTFTEIPWQQTGGHCRLANADLLRLLLVSALCYLALPSAVARSWTGDGPLVNGLRYWSHPDNWSPNGAPQNGDELSFHERNITAGSTTMFNDLPDLTVHSMTIWYQADFLTHDWTLHGNTLGISHDILLFFTSGQDAHINCGLRLEGNVLMTVDGESELYVNGPVDLNGHDLALEIYSDSFGVISEYGGLAEISGPISGNGNVHIYPTLSPDGGGAGTLRINGTVGNTFVGRVTQHSKLLINGHRGAELVLDKQSGLAVTGALMINTNCVTRLARANQLADNAPVRITAGGQLLLDGHADTIGSLFLTNTTNATAATRVDTGGAVLSVLGDITAVNHGSLTPTIVGGLDLPSGDHTFHISGSVYEGLDMQAQMMGFGNFSKSGSSALLLQASNSFNSTISILQGVLDVRNNHGLGDIAGSTAILGGGLTLRGVTIGEELLFALGRGTGGELPGSVLTSIGISSWAGQVALYTNLVVTGDMTFTGPISGEGGLGCFGGGTIRLGGPLANTYTGVTLARCPLLELNKSFDVNAFSGPLVVGGTIGGPVEVRWLNSFQCANPTVTLHPNALINLNGFNEDFGSINFNSGTIATGTGLLGINGPVSVFPNVYPGVMNGRIFLPSGYREFYVYFGDGGLFVDATVSGPGHLQKSGGGGMRLSAANSYSGLTLVDEGILTVTDPGGLGASDPGTIVAAGGTLQLLSVNGVMPELISLRGSGAAFGHGALTVVGDVTLRNPFPSIYACLDLTTNSVITVDPGSQVIADGFISGIGPLIKNGAGTLVFSNANANTYSGDTIVNAGTLELRKPFNVRAIPGDLVIGPAVPTSPAVVRFFQTGSLSVNSNVTVNANSLLDLNNNNQTLARLNLNDGGDAQTGSGELNFTAGGLVTVGTLNSFPPGLFASTSISGKIGLPVLDYLTFNVGPYGLPPAPVESELEISAVISGGGNIIKNGFGTLRLTGANTFNDAPPNLAGDLYIYGGAVIAANPLALGGPAGWTLVYNAASLALVGGISINNETLYLNTTNLTGLDNRGGHNTWFGPIVQARDSGIGVNQDWSLTVQGTISGTGSLTKRGAGLLRLGGSDANTHSGDTFVDAGLLWLTKFPNQQAVPANLIIGRSEGGTSASVMNVNSDLIWGNVTVNNGGLFNVNGYTEYIGNLTLNGGGDVQTGSGILHLFTNLTVNPGSFADQSVLSGRLGLYPGTLQFAVNAGAAPGVADCLVSAVMSHSSHSANLQKKGAGLLQLTGNNTYNGSTTITAGTIQIDGLQPQSPMQVFGGRLQGSGTVGHLIFDESKSVVAAGTSPGMLTTSNLNATALGGAKVEIELNGPTAGSGYDQINVRGTVNLSQLSLTPSLSFASGPDNEFTLINNDGADAVIGTFTGLPQNKKLYVGSELFHISYTGGTGNDVVLSRLPTPPPPNLTIERVSPLAVRLFWATNDPPFRLQSSTNLNPAAWVAAVPPGTVAGANHVLTNAMSGGAQFYRLISP